VVRQEGTGMRRRGYYGYWGEVARILDFDYDDIPVSRGATENSSGE